MNLKEKLARLDRIHQSKKPVRERIAVKPDNLLPGTILDTESGSCRIIRNRYHPDWKHDSFLPGDFLKNSPGGLAFIAKSNDFNSISLKKLLFIDTETTGLSGGIGTVAFLVGVGYFDEEAFVIDQYFMHDFHEEAAIIQSFLTILDRFRQANGALVSFNGKSYDLPLLFNRAIFHRFIRGNPGFNHVDLLHPARRFWKKYLSDCTLSTLETHILNVRREGDVPGYMIPEIYFRYLRNKDPRPLLPVFYHNQLDLLSLTGILHVMLRCYSHRENLSRTPVDWLSVGSAFDEIDDHEGGLDFYRKILEKDLAPQIQKEAMLRIARIHKKHLDYKAAIPYWERALRFPGFSVEPYEELAKVYEHRQKDLALARQYTVKALENVRLLEQLGKVEITPEIRKDLLWRLQRLERKIDNADHLPESFS